MSIIDDGRSLTAAGYQMLIGVTQYDAREEEQEWPGWARQPPPPAAIGSATTKMRLGRRIPTTGIVPRLLPQG